MRLARALVALLAIVHPGTLGATDLQGRVELVTKGGRASADDVLADAVIAFVPATPVPVSPAAEPLRIVTRNKTFVPRVVAVTVGSRVSFPNEDPILHDVFSSSPGNAFDVGLHGKGEAPAQAFDRPGVVRIFCNVHHSMVAYVVVLDTPWFVRPEADGTFRLNGLPPGPGRLTAWHPRTEPWSQDVTIPLDQPASVQLVVTQKRVPPHLDKLGQPYGQSSGGAYE